MDDPKIIQMRRGCVYLVADGVDSYYRQVAKPSDGGSEAAHELSAVGSDGKEDSYVSLYNSNVDGHDQAGIRVGKRAKNFVFDYDVDGKRVERMRISTRGVEFRDCVTLKSDGFQTATTQRTVRSSAARAGMLYTELVDAPVFIEARVTARAANGETCAAKLAGYFHVSGDGAVQIGDAQRMIFCNGDPTRWTVRFLRDGTQVHIAAQYEDADVVWYATVATQ